MRILVCVIGMATLSLAVAVSQPAAKPAVARGPYLGQKPPGKTPTIFAPGIISIADFAEIRIAFSPDGSECFFSRSSKKTSIHGICIT